MTFSIRDFAIAILLLAMIGALMSAALLGGMR
jgi:hypothetical protein